MLGSDHLDERELGRDSDRSCKSGLAGGGRAYLGISGERQSLLVQADEIGE